MANIRNLNEVNTKELEKFLMEWKKSNPELKWNIFEQIQEDEINENERLDQIEKKLDSIISKLELIFGDYVLIHGYFKNIKS